MKETEIKETETKQTEKEEQKELKPPGYRKKRRSQNKNQPDLVITLGVFLGILLVGAIIIAIYFHMSTSEATITYNGLEYSGNVRQDKPHGTGTLVFTDGTEHSSDDIRTIEDEEMKYIGEIKDGIQNGKGFLIKYNAWKYAGDFKNGLMHGEGTFFWADGTVYKGDFKEGRRNGEGELVSPDGTKYTGSFQNNEKHGEGVLISPQGIKQEGTWIEGELQ